MLNSFSSSLGCVPRCSSTWAPDWTCICRIVSPPIVRGDEMYRGETVLYTEESIVCRVLLMMCGVIES